MTLTGPRTSGSSRRKPRGRRILANMIGGMEEEEEEVKVKEMKVVVMASTGPPGGTSGS